MNLIETVELEALAKAATKGPWGYDGSYVCPARVEGGTTYVESWRSVADCAQPENTKFIAAANPAVVLALINEIAALKAGGQLLVQDRNEARAELNRLKAENEALRVAGAGALRFIAFAFDEGVEGAEMAGRAIENAIGAKS